MFYVIGWFLVIVMTIGVIDSIINVPMHYPQTKRNQIYLNAIFTAIWVIWTLFAMIGM